MDDRALKALRWILGKESPLYRTVPDGKGGMIDHVIVDQPGLDELISLLQSDDPIPRDLRNALAAALRPVGVSRMKFTLQRAARGRGRPRSDVEKAYHLHRLNKAFDERGEPPSKVDLDIEEFAKAKRVGKSTMYKARAALKKARAVEKE